jgi:hypothetical protein
VSDSLAAEQGDEADEAKRIEASQHIRGVRRTILGGRGRMKRGLSIACLLLLAALAPTLWFEARYRWDVSLVGEFPRRPELPPAPEFSVMPLWHELGGGDDLIVPPVYPWRVDLIRQVPNPSQPGLVAARWVAFTYLCNQKVDLLGEADAKNPCGGVSEQQVEALTIWLSRNWTPREVLGAYVQLEQAFWN